MQRKSKMKKITALLLAVAICVCFAGCGEQPIKLTTTSEGYLQDPETESTYILCNMSVKAYSIDTSEVYAKEGKREYYRIAFVDPKRFISESDNIMGGVYRSAEIPDITIETFEPIAALIYIVGKGEFAVDQFSAAKEYLEDTSYDFTNYTDGTVYTEAVVTAILHSEPTEMPQYVDDDETRHIRLLSLKYPGLMYNIIFMKATNGKSYLYDRGAGVCVLAPDIIVERMIG